MYDNIYDNFLMLCVSKEVEMWHSFPTNKFVIFSARFAASANPGSLRTACGLRNAGKGRDIHQTRMHFFVYDHRRYLGFNGRMDSVKRLSNFVLHGLSNVEQVTCDALPDSYPVAIYESGGKR